MKSDTAAAVGTCLGLFVASLFVPITSMTLLGVATMYVLIDWIWK